MAQVQPRKHTLDHADGTGPTGLYELDYTRSVIISALKYLSTS